MAKLMLLFCVFFFNACTIIDCSSHEDWGLSKRGWSWFNWHYYWYWRHGNWGKVSDDDTICQRLWGVDYNRLQQQNDYDIFLQSRILKNSSVDRSRRRLFRQVNMDKLLLKPTYKTFIDLLDNFGPFGTDSVSSLNVNVEKTLENIDKFLSSAMNTRVFRELYWYLVRNSFIIPGKIHFKKTLFGLWFNKGNITKENPTAFQKVFVGEVVNNPYKLSVRNWIQFYKQESKRLNYYGYIRYYRHDPKVVSVMFSWNQGVPVTDNMLIGTSPEFEMALYTLCYFTSRAEECKCKVNIKKIVVKTNTSPDGSRILNSHFEVQA